MPSTAPVLPPPSSFTPSAHRAATVQQLQSNLSTSFALLLLEADNLLISSTSGLRVAGLNDLLIVDRQEENNASTTLQPTLLHTTSVITSPLPSYDCIPSPDSSTIYSASESGINIFNTKDLLQTNNNAVPKHTFQTHPSPFETSIEVNSLYISPSSTLYSACGDLFGLYSYSTAKPQFLKNTQPSQGYLHTVTGYDNIVCWGGEDGIVWLMDERTSSIISLNIKDYLTSIHKSSKSQHVYISSILIKHPFLYVSGGIESSHNITQSGYICSVYLPSRTFLGGEEVKEVVNRLRLIEGELCGTGRSGSIVRWSPELKVIKEGKGEGEGWDLVGWKNGVIKCGGRGEVFEDYRICGHID
ncbi:hypothetical protein TrLO_g9074 [Triparma laevis f. longispina]|uniref:Uncharacterized protein n=1 Tax=Triparma laevis f. longispina TaxID=1714387 RepID=A0A9W7A2F8_9STRA|nr:hypothetical protein TrLO_g9074 [Triparma laevis f. longispina]